MKKTNDITGQVFGRLTILRRLKVRRTHKSKGYTYREYYIVKCKCGKTRTIIGTSIKKRRTKSCGCLKREREHGKSRERIYHVWVGIKQRCLNQNNPAYKDYGKRGIKICKSWLKFNRFYSDMSSSYKENLTIDRINNNGDYEKSNCRWVSRKQQAKNRRTNLIYKGRCVSEWSEQLEIGESTLRARLKRGWSWSKTLNTPVNTQFSSSHKRKRNKYFIKTSF